MNSIMTGFYPILQEYQALRNQLMDIFSDEDLAFTPGGENMTLGALCREMGEVQHAYIESFKTLKIDFSYRNREPGLDASVERLAAWFAELDRKLKGSVEALSEEDIENQEVDRGGYTLPPRINLAVYQEALLIFYGKVSVYLKCMGKERPQQWQDWIA